MSLPNKIGAVLYVRTASASQHNDEEELRNQEKLCRDYCAQNGWQVDKVFSETATSGNSQADSRPGFAELLSYLSDHKSRIHDVVVVDISRIGHDAHVVAEAILTLSKIGVVLRTVCDGNTVEAAARGLAENISGAFNLFYSISLSDKVKERSRAAVAAGGWPKPAPVGYKGVRQGVRTLLPDAEHAPLIRMAFELAAGGEHTSAEVLRIVTYEGLRSHGGMPLSSRSFHRLLTNPIYTGWVTTRSESGFPAVRGLHEPIVSQELFDRTQAAIGRKKSPIKANGN